MHSIGRKIVAYTLAATLCSIGLVSVGAGNRG